MQQTNKKINKQKRIKVVSPGSTILFCLIMQQRTQKTHYLNVGHTRKSLIAVIIQASRHNNISTFKWNLLQQIMQSFVD